MVKFDLSSVAKILIYNISQFWLFFGQKWLFALWKKNLLNSKSRKKWLVLDSETKLTLENINTKNTRNILTA